MDKNTLTKVGKWAQARVAEGQEPPWTYHKLKQLAELALELAEGMDATIAVDLPEISDVEEVSISADIVQLSDFRQNSDQVVLPS